MDVKILHLLEGAQKATGLTVVIDVFRAFTTACYVYNNGAVKIIPVGTLEEAFELKEDNPDYVLIGERKGRKPEGFDFGNSPADVENVDFKNRSVVQTTTAGVQGIVNVRNANEIITGAFVNVQSIIDYIRKRNPENVSLVCMGLRATTQSLEDNLCAEYIKNALENKDNNFKDVFKQLRDSVDAAEFFDPKVDWKPEKDFELCLSINKFNFVLKVETEGKHLVFRKLMV